MWIYFVCMQMLTCCFNIVLQFHYIAFKEMYVQIIWCLYCAQYVFHAKKQACNKTRIGHTKRQIFIHLGWRLESLTQAGDEKNSIWFDGQVFKSQWENVGFYWPKLCFVTVFMLLRSTCVLLSMVVVDCKMLFRTWCNCGFSSRGNETIRTLESVTHK